ncbi:MAG: flagellar basal body P-ring protein FlgI, partial [bacterium]
MARAQRWQFTGLALIGTLLLTMGLSLLTIGSAWADGAAGGGGDDSLTSIDGSTTSRQANGSPDGGFGATVGLHEGTGSLDLTDALGTEGGPRLKDIGHLDGVRANQLFGLGLVVGLAGTGDDSALTQQMVSNYLFTQNLTVEPGQLKGKNFSAVTITANLPGYAQSGDTLDVTVSAMGNTKSLEGGMLLFSPLKGANGEIYAAAQGPMTLGAFGASAASGGARASASKNFLTVGMIPNGATVEQAISSGIPGTSRFNWILSENDFTTAQHAAEALNKALPGCAATAEDGQRISLQAPAGYPGGMVAFIAAVEQVKVATDAIARIVINERNGTIVAGAEVKIKPVSVAHGNVTVEVTEGFAES